MTLVEVLAVIVLIALIMGVVITGISKQTGAAKAEINLIKMQKVKGYLSQYRLKYNKFPESLDNLIKSSAGI